MMRSIRHFLIVLFFVSSVFPSMAQQNTPTPSPIPPTPLALNDSIVGQVQFISESITYALEVPADQDVIIAYQADRVLMPSYCTTVTTITDETASQADDCYRPGGGGGDAPISRIEYLPATDQPETQQSVEFTLTRPYEGPAHYQLEAYPVTPQLVSLDQTLEVSADDLQRFQVYSLEVDPTQAFTVAIADEADDGNFLWAAYNPYDFSGDSLTLSDERQLLPQYVDGALLNEEDVDAIAKMQLYYLGGQTFRVIVEATDAYTLQTTALSVPSFAENQSVSATLSYLRPMQITRIEAPAGSDIIVNVTITEGIGALVRVTTAGSIDSDFVALGTTTTGSTFSLSGTIEHVIGAEGESYIIAQIPFEFIRDSVTINVSWQQE